MPSGKTSPGASGPWSDGETSALVDAWGPLHLRRSPGGGALSVDDWRVVCSAVNAQRAAEGRGFNRTLVQCQKRVYTLKYQYKRELDKARPTPRWRHFALLRAFLADSPPGFPAKTSPAASVKEDKEETSGGAGGVAGRTEVPPATVKKEKGEEEEEVVEEMSVGVAGGLAGMREVPPAAVKKEEVASCGCELAGSAGCCPGAVVTKLAEVYERVEMKRLGVEQNKVEMEKHKISSCSFGHKKMKLENPDDTDGN